VRLILDEGHNHAVEVEEEHDEMEAKFCERFLWIKLADNTDPAIWASTNLLVDVELAEDLGSIQKMCVVHNPTNPVSNLSGKTIV
jgi:hypothetical protein